MKKRRRPRTRASLKVDAFMPIWIGDYKADTAHLDALGDGCYLNLLMHYWRTGPLPADDAALARIAKASPEQWAVWRDVVRAFFQERGGLLHHSRVERELKDAIERREKLQLRARKSATTRWEKKNGDASRLHNACPSPSPSTVVTSTPSPNGEGVSPTRPATPPKRVVPDCPHEHIVALYHEILPANPQVREWTGARQDYLRGRWREMSVPKGKRSGYTTVEAGLAWWRMFFQHVAGSPFLTGQVNGREGRPFIPSLEWMVRPSNFYKIYEGTYHDAR